MFSISTPGLFYGFQEGQEGGGRYVLELVSLMTCLCVPRRRAWPLPGRIHLHLALAPNISLHPRQDPEVFVPALLLFPLFSLSLFVFWTGNLGVAKRKEEKKSPQNIRGETCRPLLLLACTKREHIPCFYYYYHH